MGDDDGQETLPALLRAFMMTSRHRLARGRWLLRLGAYAAVDVLRSKLSRRITPVKIGGLRRYAEHIGVGGYLQAGPSHD